MATAEDLGIPTPLQHAVWVHATWGDEKTRIICAACDLVRVSIGDHPEEECLSMLGYPFGDETPDLSVPRKVAQVVMPCRYVTYVTLGPEMPPPADLSGATVDKMLFLPDSPPVAGRMSVKAIRASLAEFGGSPPAV